MTVLVFAENPFEEEGATFVPGQELDETQRNPVSSVSY
jgi:hypothetical protein